LWFDRLGGKPVADSDSDAVREADALRLAFQLEEERLDGDAELAAITSDAALQRQLKQLHSSAGPGAWSDPSSTRWWHRWTDAAESAATIGRWPAAAGLAAVIALSAVLVVPLWNRNDDPGYDQPPERMGADGARELRVTEPRKEAEAFAADLRQAGLAFRVYRRDKVYVVDVDLELEQIPAAVPAFKRVGLEPRPGYSRIEFTKR
jgi:hypothetical protein